MTLRIKYQHFFSTAFLEKRTYLWILPMDNLDKSTSHCTPHPAELLIKFILSSANAKDKGQNKNHQLKRLPPY